MTIIILIIIIIFMIVIIIIMDYDMIFNCLSVAVNAVIFSRANAQRRPRLRSVADCGFKGFNRWISVHWDTVSISGVLIGLIV